MLLFHASDIHLDSPLVGLDAYEGCPREALRGATRKALANLVSAAIEEQASALLIAGDLYDGAWRDYSTGLHFVAQMRRLREANIPVVIVRGNHDAESQITKHVKLPENVHDLSTSKPQSIELEELGLVVHGQGFAVRDVRDDLAKNYPRPIAGAFNVGMLHTALLGREGHETYAPTTLSVLADKGYDYWALGHVHRSEVVSRAPFVVYPGNLQGRHVRETGPKGATLVTVEGGKVVGLEHRSFDVVRWMDCTISASAEDRRADVLEQVEVALQDAIRGADGRLLAGRVNVVGAAGIHAEVLRAIDAFVADVRAIGLDVASDQLWIGDVRLLPAPLTPSDRPPRTNTEEPTDPLTLIRSAAERAARDPEAARELCAALADLTAKLPEELRSHPSLAFLEDPAHMGDVLGDVEELLIGLLTSTKSDL